MSYLYSISLGVIQGLTEFLPISSSGHLILLPKLFHFSDQGLAFDVAMHLATALAVLIVLRKDILRIIKGMFIAKSNNKTWLYILLGIIPAGLAGFFLDSYIESNLRSPQLVAFNLIFFGFILWLAERYSHKKTNPTNNLEKIGWRKSLVVGFTQILSLSPGTSRSGITISTGLFANFSRETAIKFSFILSLPLILAAGIYKATDLHIATLSSPELINLVVGFLASFISGILAIKLMLRFITRHGFKYLILYRILLGIAIFFIFL